MCFVAFETVLHIDRYISEIYIVQYHGYISIALDALISCEKYRL